MTSDDWTPFGPASGEEDIPTFLDDEGFWSRVARQGDQAGQRLGRLLEPGLGQAEPDEDDEAAQPAFLDDETFWANVRHQGYRARRRLQELLERALVEASFEDALDDLEVQRRWAWLIEAASELEGMERERTAVPSGDGVVGVPAAAEEAGAEETRHLPVAAHCWPVRSHHAYGSPGTGKSSLALRRWLNRTLSVVSIAGAGEVMHRLGLPVRRRLALPVGAGVEESLRCFLDRRRWGRVVTVHSVRGPDTPSGMDLCFVHVSMRDYVVAIAGCHSDDNRIDVVVGDLALQSKSLVPDESTVLMDLASWYGHRLRMIEVREGLMSLPWDGFPEFSIRPAGIDEDVYDCPSRPASFALQTHAPPTRVAVDQRASPIAVWGCRNAVPFLRRAGVRQRWWGGGDVEVPGASSVLGPPEPEEFSGCLLCCDVAPDRPLAWNVHRPWWEYLEGILIVDNCGVISAPACAGRGFLARHGQQTPVIGGARWNGAVVVHAIGEDPPLRQDVRGPLAYLDRPAGGGWAGLHRAGEESLCDALTSPPAGASPEGTAIGAIVRSRPAEVPE